MVGFTKKRVYRKVFDQVINSSLLYLLSKRRLLEYKVNLH